MIVRIVPSAVIDHVVDRVWGDSVEHRQFLDVTPATIGRFEAAGDSRSAAILERIYRDEIRHVAAGTRWFRIGCEAQRIGPVSHWKRLVGLHFRGSVKPPFNDSARLEAGLSREFYAGVDAARYV